MLVPIHETREWRRDDPHGILIAPLSWTVKKNTFYDPKVFMEGTYHYNWGEVQKYFILNLKKRNVPMHWYIEQVDEDYVVIQAMNMFNESWWLQELYDVGIIPYHVTRYLLVVVGENWAKDIPDDRMYMYMCENVLCPLLRHYSMLNTNVEFIEEVCHPNYVDILREAGNPYPHAKPQVKYDRNTLLHYMKKYDKKKMKGV